MRNKKVKAIRKQIRSEFVDINDAEYDYIIPAHLKSAVEKFGGIEKYAAMMGRAPVTVYLKENCIKKKVKEAKRA